MAKEVAKKVLLVDDEPLVLNMFQEYCELAGIACETACSGYRALEAFENDLEGFGVIVADTSPGVIELARTARQKFPLLPIVFATGRSAFELKHTIAIFNARIIEKPCSMARFIEVIENALTPSATG